MDIWALCVLIFHYYYWPGYHGEENCPKFVLLLYIVRYVPSFEVVS